MTTLLMWVCNVTDAAESEEEETCSAVSSNQSYSSRGLIHITISYGVGLLHDSRAARAAGAFLCNVLEPDTPAVAWRVWASPFPGYPKDARHLFQKFSLFRKKSQLSQLSSFSRTTSQLFRNLGRLAWGQKVKPRTVHVVTSD